MNIERKIPQQIVRVRVQLNPQHSGADLSRARDIILKWLKLKKQIEVPAEGWSGKSFYAYGKQRGFVADVVASENVWAMRFEHPDAVGRRWVNEAILENEKNSFHRFETRLVCYRGYNSDPPPLSMPGYVRVIADGIGLLDSFCPLIQSPHHIGSIGGRDSAAEDVRRLHQFIFDARRDLPVVVLSERKRRGQASEGFVLDPATLADKLHGVAHVFTLPDLPSRLFSDLIGKKWSVYDGGIRYYRPNISTERDALIRHPLALMETVRYWEEIHGIKYSDHLQKVAYGDSVSTLETAKLYSFASAKVRILQYQSVGITSEQSAEAVQALPIPAPNDIPDANQATPQASSSSEECGNADLTRMPEVIPAIEERSIEEEKSIEEVEAIIPAPMADTFRKQQALVISTLMDRMRVVRVENLQQAALIENLTAQVAALGLENETVLGMALEQEERANAATRDLEAMTSQLENANVLIKHLREENVRLRSKKIDEFKAASAEMVIPFPDSLDKLQGWVDEYFRDRLLITGRAINAAKKSEYHDPQFVYQCLALIGREYYDAVIGKLPQSRDIWNKAQQDIGVEISKTFGGDGPRVNGDKYYVSVDDERILLDRHLSHGKSHDPRYCLRIYFSPNEARKRIVIGHLPNHLPSVHS